MMLLFYMRVIEDAYPAPLYYTQLWIGIDSKGWWGTGPWGVSPRQRIYVPHSCILENLTMWLDSPLIKIDNHTPMGYKYTPTLDASPHHPCPMESSMTEINDYEIDQELTVESEPQEPSDLAPSQDGGDSGNDLGSGSEDERAEHSDEGSQTVCDAIAAARPEDGGPEFADGPEFDGYESRTGGEDSGDVDGSESAPDPVETFTDRGGNVKVIDHRTSRQIRKDRNAGR